VRKVAVSRPIKSISTLGGYLIVELDSGVMTIEKIYMTSFNSFTASLSI